MAERHLRQRALAHRALGARAAAPVEPAGVRLWLEAPCVQLALRGDGGRGFRRRVAGVLGLEPPLDANTVAGDGERRVLWLGPDEWLAVCAEGQGAWSQRALEQALEGEHSLVSDVSHSRVIFGLEGPHAREVLMKGCSLDLDPVAFAPGRCAQSVLARAHMLLHQVGDAPGYHVYVHRSFADYAFAWLEDAAAEYGLAVG